MIHVGWDEVAKHVGGTRKLPSSVVQHSVVAEAARERPKSHRPGSLLGPLYKAMNHPGCGQPPLEIGPGDRIGCAMRQSLRAFDLSQFGKQFGWSEHPPSSRKGSRNWKKRGSVDQPPSATRVSAVPWKGGNTGETPAAPGEDASTSGSMQGSSNASKPTPPVAERARVQLSTTFSSGRMDIPTISMLPLSAWRRTRSVIGPNRTAWPGGESLFPSSC